MDVLPVFAGDERITRLFTLVPGSDFDAGALTAVEHAGAQVIPWAEAHHRAYDLVLLASPKGDVDRLRGPRVLLPHGAGFSKTVAGEGTSGVASGLDPFFLRRDGRSLPSIHALAHPSHLRRLGELDLHATAQARVVGDPTLDRILASVPSRDRFRTALRTGARKLIVLTSTWGPQSLIRQRPELPALLRAALPLDEYQVALLIHPNEHARLGALNLNEQLRPAIDAGLVLASPYQEWASLLVAADAVVTDHGSAGLYAAALNRPLVAACHGGEELIPGTPMSMLLAQLPYLASAEDLEAALGAADAEALVSAVDQAFAHRGEALAYMRAALYGVLGLEPPDLPVAEVPLPVPSIAPVSPAAFAVDVTTHGTTARIARYPTYRSKAGHHIAAVVGVAGHRHLQSAAVVYSHAAVHRNHAPQANPWTVAAWTALMLDEYPGCRTAAVILSRSRCIVRTRSTGLWTMDIAPARDGGRVVHTDPAAVLSAAHVLLNEGPSTIREFSCVIGQHGFGARLFPSGDEAALPFET
ncbi:translation initiation factor 2 [Yinghuangia sp. ASG 101]|uniref:translation initiation factor 2 n=1 Tax=Yinghuangia sp. ASG 101 TaxID=2896848 RepID=UPI001E5BF9EE|nr:translation initiation factor 2 [Yinghuangia sp. ASG 101]UGQ13986.1 translation initiation factor 2 [Yinghuangia sp. ASG 101]